MKYSLRTKLSLSYIFVALISISLISIVSNLLLERHFAEYIIQNQERKNEEIASLVSRQYESDGKWDIAAIEDICINALKQGVIIRVVDSSEKVIWDARLHDNEYCERIITHMAKNMSSRYPGWEGKYTVEKYPISEKLNVVGRIEIGYYGPYFFNDSDLKFINNINQLLIGVGLFSLLLSLVIASLMARRLSGPILKVIGTARMISKGYFNDRIIETSSTKEISELTETINKLAETLEKQETLRKKLTADVAHELRTPLATLQSHMEAMIDGIWKPEPERLKSCHEEIMRIGRMVGDLEKLARYESENLILMNSEFDVCELIQHIMHNFETSFMEKGIDIHFTGKKELMFADKDKISQVITNLLSNALKYTGLGGRVELMVKGSDETIEIYVKDTGEGIRAEDIPHIFDRFYRADKSRNRMTGGAGIGLTISKAIVEAHKGKIEVKSQLGVGTEFTIILPKNLS